MSWRGDNDDDDDRHGILLLRSYLVAIFHLAYHRLSYLVTTHNILLDAAFDSRRRRRHRRRLLSSPELMMMAMITPNDAVGLLRIAAVAANKIEMN